jgi:hypothetical protein
MENNTDLHIVKQEYYDPDVMESILRNTDNFSKQDINRLKNYKKSRLHGNCVKVVYYYGKGCEKYELGRLYVQNNNGLQSFPFDIRNPLLEKNYWDIDGENMHYVLMAKLAEKWNINVPNINYYCNNRDKCLSELSSDRKIAKTAFLKVAYGGNIKLHNEYYNSDNLSPDGDITLLSEIEKETKNLMIICYENYSEYQHIVKKKDNPKASLFALILQTEERKCILALDMFYKSIGRSVDILIHDGVEVRKLPNETAFPEQLLRDGEKAIFDATGYNIKLVCKPLKHNFTINKEPNIIIDDIYAAKKFIELNGNNIVRDKDDVYYFNDNNGMWEKSDTAFRVAVNKHKNNLIFFDPNSGNNINYGGFEKNVKNMQKWILPLLDDNEFITKNIDSSIGKLLFANGYYDFVTDTFYEKFNQNIVFLKRINRTFPTERNEEIINKINKILFIDPFNLNNNYEAGTYLKKSLCMAIFGDYFRKQFTFAIGEPNSGKGVIVNAFRESFGGYIDEFDANNLLHNPNNSQDEAKKLAWLTDIIGIRICFSNEIRIQKDGSSHKQKSICGCLLKTLSSGSDKMKIRTNGKDQYDFVNRASMYLFVNDMPNINPCDNAVIMRCKVTPFQKSFINNPDPNNNKQAKSDPSIKIKFSTDEYKNSLFFLMTDTYKILAQNEKELGGYINTPDIVDLEIKKWMINDNTNFIDKINEAFEITNNPNDFTPTNKIIEYIINNSNLNMSVTKIGIEINKLITLDEKDKIIKKQKCKLGIKTIIQEL